MNEKLALQIDLFADLMARLDDPFGERTTVLAAEGLSDEQAVELMTAWRRRFERDRPGDLARAFSAAYAERRATCDARRRRAASGEIVPTDPRLLHTEAQSSEEEAAHVARDSSTPWRTTSRLEEKKVLYEDDVTQKSPPVLPSYVLMQPVAPTASPSIDVMIPIPLEPRSPAALAGTADISAAVRRAALPFAPQGSSTALPAVPAQFQPILRPFTGTTDISTAVARAKEILPFEQQHGVSPPPPTGSMPPVMRPPPHLSGTIDVGAHVPLASLPFALGSPAGGPAPVAPPRGHTPFENPALATSSPAPRRRLIRFDPQTGQPLPEPTWVDLPPEPVGHRK
jgi:hypothetical protein